MKKVKKLKELVRQTPKVPEMTGLRDAVDGDKIGNIDRIDRIDKIEDVDRIELFASGIAIGSIENRPVLLLKDKAGNEVLPVWMNPLEAGIAIAEVTSQLGSPHGLTIKLLKSLGISVEKCVFVEVVGFHQYVELFFSGHPNTLKVRADEAMSFCLTTKARFFSSTDLIRKCRELHSEIVIESVALGKIKKEHSPLQKYLM